MWFFKKILIAIGLFIALVYLLVYLLAYLTKLPEADCGGISIVIAIAIIILIFKWKKIVITLRVKTSNDGCPLSKSRRKQDRLSAISVAKEILKNKDNFVILDTETTGLNEYDEIIQLAIIDLNGNILFEKNFYPTKRGTIPPTVSEIHGLTMKSLEGNRSFAESKKNIELAINNKNIITYNIEFDKRMYLQTYNLDPENSYYPHNSKWYCAMRLYAQYCNQWDSHYGHYKWHKLEGGDHTALGDCFATLKLIKEMAKS